MRNSKEIRNEIETTGAAKKELNRRNGFTRGGYDATDCTELNDLHKELTAAEFAENWSAEQTAAKRIIFNDAIRKFSRIAKTKREKMFVQDKAEKETGIKLYALKKAVAFHA